MDASSGPDPLDAELSRLQLDEMTRVVTDCAYKVGSTLGAGFPEKVYGNALSHELRKTGFAVEQQCPVPVIYDGVIVGEYAADLVVNGVMMIQLKTVERLNDGDMARCASCLRAAGLRICLLVNYGSARVDIERIVKDG